MKSLLRFLSLFLIITNVQGQIPVLNWVRQMGGVVNEYSYAITVDQSGNVYTTGTFTQTADFDPGPGVYNLTAPGSSTAMFVSKLDANGNFVWARGMSGTDVAAGQAIAVDNSGNVYIGGYFTGTADFNPGGGTYNLTSAGQADAVFCKLDASGNFVWAKQTGGTANDYCRALCLDNNNNVFFTGSFNGMVDFDPSAGMFFMSSLGLTDIFITRLRTSGAFVWAKKLGGAGNEDARGITSDGSSGIFTTGSFSAQVDFDPGTGTWNLLPSGLNDVFVSKIDTAGNFVWARRMGGADHDYGQGIAVDAAGNVYTTGFFSGTADFDPGGSSVNLVSAGLQDIFVSKLDALGTFVWAKRMGGLADDVARAIDVDNAGNVYTTGYFWGTADFDPGADTMTLNPYGDEDIFISKLSSAGNYEWAVQLGGSYVEAGYGIYVDQAASVYTTGFFGQTADFDPQAGVHNLNSFSGSLDAYVHKIKQCFHSSSTVPVTACGSYTAPSGNYTWTSGGTYHDTILNHSGCDSLMTIILTIKENAYSAITVTACDSYTSPGGNSIWTVSNTYLDTIPATGSCDSIITIHLTVNYSSTSTIFVTACDSYVSPSGNFLWTASGIYHDTIPNTDNCDSLITIHLTINHSTTATFPVTACESYISPSGNYLWTGSGMYHDTIPNTAGCDSLITIHLTITHNSSATLSESVCDAYVSPSGNYVWTTSGIYHDTIPNHAGCDSLLTIHVTVNHSTASGIFVTACDHYVSPGGSYIWTVSGIYADTITNQAGCDSIVNIHLTVNHSTSTDTSINACDSYTSPSGNYTWTGTGTYYDTISNMAGCDSILIINLTITHATSSAINVSACGHYLSPGGNYVWTTSGIYHDTIPNHAGCDSLMTIHLNIGQSTSAGISDTVCDSSVSPSGLYVWTSTGNYHDTIANSAGCDSLLTIHLLVHYSTSAVIHDSACYHYLSPGGNYVWTSSGTYHDTITNAAGCDSIITVHLLIKTVDVTVTDNSPTLSANATGATYQWVNCNNNYAIIPNETGQSFTAANNGLYAVIVTQNGCTDTSDCIHVTWYGIAGTAHERLLLIYPNPSSGAFHADFGPASDFSEIIITDMLGKTILRQPLDKSNHLDFFIPASGLYMLTAITASGTVVHRKVEVCR